MGKESVDRETVVQSLMEALRSAGAAASQHGGASSTIWPDRNHEWQGIFETLKEIMPEVSVFGDYDPSGRRVPALWPACVEARVLAVDGPPDRIPLFYPPAISWKELRDPEDLPTELQPLAAMRFRGAEWVQASQFATCCFGT